MKMATRSQITNLKSQISNHLKSQIISNHLKSQIISNPKSPCVSPLDLSLV